MRVLIRRPHAYWFLQQYPDLLESLFRPAPGDAPPGVIVVDGTKAPIPGFVFLSAAGELQGMVALQGPNARLELLRTMEELSSKGRSKKPGR